MKVLVLDCDARVSRGLERTLRVLGHEVRCPPAASAARATLEADPAVDVILSAQHLDAGERGTEFLRWAEAHVPEARRVLISGTHCPPDFVEQPGMQCFQAKPFGRRELETLLALPPTHLHRNNSPAPGPAEGNTE
jgi:DNA-binding NtrC family response regulator